LLFEADHEIIRITDNLRGPSASFGETTLKPPVQCVVKVDVGQHRGNKATLRYSGPRRCKGPILNHPCFEKALKDPQKASISYPVFDKPQQMLVVHLVEEALDSSLNNELRALMCEHFRDAPKRIMRAAIWAEAIRARSKLRFPDRLQDLAEPFLYDPIRNARYS
jgi:hypothetical protein